MTVDTVEKSSYGPIFPITIKKSDIVLEAADKAGHKITRVFGFNSSILSDHRFLQCVDYMHYGNTAMRKWLENYLIEKHHRLGIMGLISNGWCMGFPGEETVRADREVYWNGPSGVWRKYYGKDQHTDHIHVQYNTEPVEGDPKPAPKPTYPKPHSGEVFLSRLRSGTLNSDSVYYWQMALNAIPLRGGEELKLDGDYRAATVDETKRYQQQICNDDPDGWPGSRQAVLGFRDAKREMRNKGVDTLSLYHDPDKRTLIEKLW
jgi:hypothetical protein